MKIFVFAFCIAVGGYVFAEIIGVADPVFKKPLAGLSQKEINQGIPTLEVASGEDAIYEDNPSFE